MSLLDGNDTVQVYPEVEGALDAYGNTIRTAGVTPTAVMGRVQPLTGAEDRVEGQSVDTKYRFLGRSWPGGAFSRVVWDDREWSVDGEPLIQSGSPATAHVVVFLKARGAADI